jgi:predicted exporter
MAGKRSRLSLRLVDELGAELQGSPYLSHVQVHLDDPVRLAEAVLRHAVLFLDEDGLRGLEQRLTDDGLARRAADIRASLETPQGMIAKELALTDPLGLLPLLLGRVSQAPAALKVDLASGYYLSADHSMVLLLARPNGPAQDIGFDEAMFADLDERAARVRARLAEAKGIGLVDVPEVLFGGGHRIAVEDASLIRSDVITNSMTSLACVLLLFFVAYRRWWANLYAFLPLAAGLALTFAFAYLTLGRLNSATAGFSAMLVGLGIDFTIVMYGRYLEERLTGEEIGPALATMAASSGPAVALGAVTTLGTFYAFLFTHLPGLREFGLLTGTGIILLGLAAFLLLPALITLLDRGRTPRPHPRVFDVDGLIDSAMRHRRLVLGAAALATVGSLFALPLIRFDDDVRTLRSPSNRGTQIQERVGEAFGFTFSSMVVIVDAPTVDEVFDRVRQLGRGLEPMRSAGVIASYESLASLVPPPEPQRRALDWLARNSALTDPDRVRRVFGGALREQGLVVEAFAPALDELDEMLRPPGPISVDIWRGTPIEQVVDRSLRTTAGGFATVVNIFAYPGEWKREPPPPLVELVGRVPGATLTGVAVISQHLRRTTWRDAALCGVLGLVFVSGILYWQLRSWRGLGYCLVPMVLGVLWTLGVLAAAGLPLNQLNVFVTTMIVGIGSDYGIHIYHRFREGADVARLAETARAVLLAALTTVVGFGSLILTHYPGLQSIGWMTGLGVLLSCFAAIVVLPLLLDWRTRS